MQAEKNEMNRDSSTNPIQVIGTDAAGLENIPLRLKETILSVNKIAAPKRLFQDINTWWTNQNKQLKLNMS